MSVAEDKREFFGYVVQAIVSRGVTHTSAEAMVSSSAFAELLEVDPEYVMHRSARYWADRVLSGDNLR